MHSSEGSLSVVYSGQRLRDCSILYVKKTCVGFCFRSRGGSASKGSRFDICIDIPVPAL